MSHPFWRTNYWLFHEHRLQCWISLQSAISEIKPKMCFIFIIFRLFSLSKKYFWRYQEPFSKGISFPFLLQLAHVIWKTWDNKRKRQIPNKRNRAAKGWKTNKEQYLQTLTEVKRSRRANIRTFDPECSFANTTTKLTKPWNWKWKCRKYLLWQWKIHNYWEQFYIDWAHSNWLSATYWVLVTMESNAENIAVFTISRNFLTTAKWQG